MNNSGAQSRLADKLLDLVQLRPLMERTEGSSDIGIGVIDGPVAVHHPDLAGARLLGMDGAGTQEGACAHSSSFACVHGTFVAGILCARRGSEAPAICPGCTLLLRPLFSEAPSPVGTAMMPTATPADLAAALIAVIQQGARIINLSVALSRSSPAGDPDIQEALDFAARRETIIVAAAGNEAGPGGSSITSHPWVIPVVACNPDGSPDPLSSLSRSSGQNGLRAPGASVTSLVPSGQVATMGGSSVAAPFVTGAISLLWSLFPRASASSIWMATVRCVGPRNSIVPPLLNAWASFQALAARSF